MVFNISSFFLCGSNFILISASGNGTDSKLNTALLKDYSEVLRRFVENVVERELQLLFAVQTLVTQRQHPKGNFSNFTQLLKVLYYHLIVCFFQVLFKGSLRLCTTVTSSPKKVSNRG